MRNKAKYFFLAILASLGVIGSPVILFSFLQFIQTGKLLCSFYAALNWLYFVFAPIFIIIGFLAIIYYATVFLSRNRLGCLDKVFLVTGVLFIILLISLSFHTHHCSIK